ncbi:hypothetical protein MYCTH_2298844 [Thermothelomyces thermophilus ATCC 42464]|uniref:Sodium/calcium exchanger membrane region domain-containing protein n=1 Tax=Thermothelomyces thermophilus (strain ATCC 42464 / BCRC 31852 / DSM 1799) TaxID=573729 RepID=G2Q3G3_THET4|nr:uncharacterized protein MYCTH_2298844 [Thermothelomyces thermophilus ATCC 42464]AEO55223.1 hypothetical protein MYCTH_2298844 [Thermothelomyces thermophilus ATCC 42464]
MASYNAYRNRMQAFREAGNSGRWNPFAHNRSKSLTLPHTYDETGGDLEGQRLGPAASAPEPPSSAGNESKETAAHRPQTGESSAELRPSEQDAQESSATVTQPILRQRTSARDQSSDATAVPAPETEKPKKKKKKERTFFKHLTPKEPFTVRNQIQRTLFGGWINILLLAAPAGIAINYIPSVSRVAVFVVNFIAIVPLASLLGFATEEIALRTGETIGGLLNATFGNAVELIVAIIALVHDEVVIVQTSLIGSILSNLLLVLGMCFFFGGLHRQEQYFNTTVAQTAASLLALAVAGVIVPTVFDISSKTPTSDVAKLSRGTSVILLVVYGAYLFFQLHTHSAVFAQESQKVEAKPFKNPMRSQVLKDGAVAQGFVAPAGVAGGYGLPTSRTDNEKMRDILTNPPRKSLLQEGEEEEDDEAEEEPQLHFAVAVALLTISTVVIAFCAEFMVDGISAVTAGGTVSAEFVGLILLPLVGNAAEHATAVTVAIKDKMDLAIGVAVGSSMQVALFVIPLLVIIGWGMGMDAMALSFDPFQVAVLFVAVLLVNYLIADGKSHWLEGLLLICLYCIIAVCSWWYPTEHGSEGSKSTLTLS